MWFLLLLLLIAFLVFLAIHFRVLGRLSSLEHSVEALFSAQRVASRNSPAYNQQSQAASKAAAAATVTAPLPPKS